MVSSTVKNDKIIKPSQAFGYRGALHRLEGSGLA